MLPCLTVMSCGEIEADASVASSLPAIFGLIEIDAGLFRRWIRCSLINRTLAGEFEMPQFGKRGVPQQLGERGGKFAPGRHSGGLNPETEDVVPDDGGAHVAVVGV